MKVRKYLTVLGLFIAASLIITSCVQKNYYVTNPYNNGQHNNDTNYNYVFDVISDNFNEKNRKDIYRIDQDQVWNRWKSVIHSIDIQPIQETLDTKTIIYKVPECGTKELVINKDKDNNNNNKSNNKNKNNNRSNNKDNNNNI